VARRSDRLDGGHERWLLTRRFDDPALTATDGHYRAVLDARDAPLEAIQADLASWYGGHRSPMPWPAWPPTGGHPPGRAHLGQRGRRLAPVRQRSAVHGFSAG
jgi:hypothetical protein